MSAAEAMARAFTRNVRAAMDEVRLSIRDLPTEYDVGTTMAATRDGSSVTVRLRITVGDITVIRSVRITAEDSASEIISSNVVELVLEFASKWVALQRRIGARL